MRIGGSPHWWARATVLVAVVTAILAQHPTPWPGDCKGVANTASRQCSLPAGTTIEMHGSVRQPKQAGTIVLAGPLSLRPDNKHYHYARMIRRSLTVFADWLHNERDVPGIQVGNQTYSLQLVWVDDNSSVSLVGDSTAYAVRAAAANFVMAPYGSTLTSVAAAQSKMDNRLMLAGSASLPPFSAKTTLYCLAQILALKLTSVARSLQLPTKPGMLELIGGRR